MDLGRENSKHRDFEEGVNLGFLRKAITCLLDEQGREREERKLGRRTETL